MRLDFNTWDNFEFFTPIIWEAHTRWLKGEIPLMNPFQHGGTPFDANLQAGLFYPIYTLAVACVQLSGGSPLTLMYWITGVHLAIFALATYLLSRVVGARSELAIALAIGSTLGGFACGYAAIWVYLPATLAWFTLGLWALLASRFGFLFLSSAMLGLIGQPQMWLYAMLAWAAFALIQTPWRARFRGLTSIALGVVAATPAWVPSLRLLKLSSRGEALPLHEFEKFSLTKSSLYGVLVPFLRVNDGVLFEHRSLLLWQGPAVALGVLLAIKGIKHVAASSRKLWITTLAVASVLIFFSLGANFIVYRFTHGIPLWSSFRWPFKFAAIFLPLLTLLAALGLASYSKWTHLKMRSLLAFSVLSGCLTLWGAQDNVHKGYSAGVVELDEARTVLGRLDSDYLVLPASSVSNADPDFFLFGLFNTPSLTQVRSATGSVHPFMPREITQKLALDRVDGLLHERDLEQKLADGTLRTLGVRYYLTLISDQLTHLRLKKAGLTPLFSYKSLEVYEDRNALKAPKKAPDIMDL